LLIPESWRFTRELSTAPERTLLFIDEILKGGLHHGVPCFLSDLSRPDVKALRKGYVSLLFIILMPFFTFRAPHFKSPCFDWDEFHPNGIGQRFTLADEYERE